MNTISVFLMQRVIFKICTCVIISSIKYFNPVFTIVNTIFKTYNSTRQNGVKNSGVINPADKVNGIDYTFKLPKELSERAIIKIKKISKTPSIYPRRYDKIIKYPLKKVSK